MGMPEEFPTEYDRVAIKFLAVLSAAAVGTVAALVMLTLAVC